MSQAAQAFQRCPRCGNENKGEDYQCSFCGKRLRIETIEKFFLFRRIEEEWSAPAAWYRKILWLFRDPPRAFHDINHKRSKAPGFIILWINSLLWGLMGLAFFSHFQIVSINGTPVTPLDLFLFPYGLSMFLSFFLFGTLYQLIFYTILNWLFTKGANYAVGFSERLEARFGGGKGDEKEYDASEISVFSIYKSGTLLQKQESHKNKMMLCAFTPFLLINTIKIVIILAGFPNTQVVVASIGSSSFDSSIFGPMFNSSVWGILDFLEAITIAVWVPILASIAIRELANSSTYRVLISSFIIGIIASIFFYFMRPTLFGIAVT